jgi:hypothetical protein
MPSRKVRRKWQKKWEREAKRETRRAEREAQRARSRSPLQGGMYAVVAVACVLMAMAQPRNLWWLVFVALGFFLSAARHLERPRRGGTREVGGEALPREAEAREAGDSRTREPGAPPSTGEAMDPRVAKVDGLCGKLLAELREGPAVLREVVHAPERTVEALRQGCHELARRERGLRTLVTPEETRRLESEREALAARVSAEQDAVVRERLTGALTALDEQRRQRAELATAADRLEAEHTRLYYTLEGLYAQVLRVRSADAVGEDVAGAGLRHSMEQLGAEVDAVTEALEEVHRAPDGRTRTR